MGRRRKAENRDLPKYVYKGTSGYYVMKKGVNLGTIAKLDATLREIREGLKQLEDHDLPPNSFPALCQLYYVSEKFAEKADRTKLDYKACQAYPQKALARVPDCSKLKPHHIRKIMDARGKSSKTRANRELSFMSNVFGHAIQYGRMTLNPCKGVQKFTEKVRDRYVTDQEFNAVLAVAPASVQVAMKLAYLTGLRQADLLDLKWSQVSDEGISVTQQKTGKALLKTITAPVRDALQQARQLPGVASVYVLHNRSGSKYTRHGFSAMFRRSVAAAECQPFRFHDLRRKGATDYDGQTKEFTGHTSDAIAEKVYNVAAMKSPSLDK